MSSGEEEAPAQTEAMSRRETDVKLDDVAAAESNNMLDVVDDLADAIGAGVATSF